MPHDFNAAAHIVEFWEGGWSDHKADPGGLTRYGWTLKTLIARGIDVNLDGRFDGQDLRDLTPERARALYRKYFWTENRCDDLPPPLALLVFNSAVNQGPGRAARFLQAAVGAKVDGAIGPATIAAAGAAWFKNPRKVLYEFLARQMMHYTSLAIFATFGLGWARRTMHVALTAGAWVSEIEAATKAPPTPVAPPVQVAPVEIAPGSIDPADFISRLLRRFT